MWIASAFLVDFLQGIVSADSGRDAIAATCRARGMAFDPSACGI
jgi:hypothetical protein